MRSLIVVVVLLVASSAGALSDNPCVREAELEELIDQAIEAYKVKMTELDVCQGTAKEVPVKCIPIRDKALSLLEEAKALNTLRREASQLCKASGKRDAGKQ